MTITAKICGITSKEAIDIISSSSCIKYAGFVFFPRSPRHLSYEKAAQLITTLPNTIASVAVMVNPSNEELHSLLSCCTPDYIQLHGEESPERIMEIKDIVPSKLIKAFKVRSGDDIAQSGQFESLVDMFLFDAKEPKDVSLLPGGNGLAFDWNLLSTRQFDLPWMLSGGINSSNVAQAIQISGAKIVDLSSSLESSAGIKDPALLKEFLEILETL